MAALSASPSIAIRAGWAVPLAAIFQRRGSRFCAGLGIEVQVCDPHHPAHNGFVERYHRTYQDECLALDRPADLEQAKAVTSAFVRHSNVERPHQGLACANRPPLRAFPHLPELPALPATVDPDSWLAALDRLHLQRKVDRYGMISIDLKRDYISTQLVGQHVVLHLDAQLHCFQVFHEHQLIKSVPLRGLVGHTLAFEQFLAHLLHQARAQARLRSWQERKYRTAAVASP